MYESDDDKKGLEIIKQADKAFQQPERGNAESTWAELAEFILPTKAGGFKGDETKGIKRDTRVFDSEAIRDSRDLASAMHATITSPSSQWSKLKFKDLQFEGDANVDGWIQNAVRSIHDNYNESNFDSQIGECYQSLTALGTALLFHEEIEDAGVFQKFNFIAWHLAEVALVENQFGLIDTTYRKFQMSLKQMYEKFGDKIGQDRLEALARDPLKEEWIYHCIKPRHPDKVKLNGIGLAPASARPFESVYIAKKGNSILKEDGYYEFPVYTFRWSKLAGETYGVGPGHIARADIRTVNKMKEEDLRAQAKNNNPPIISTQSNIVSSDLRPGKVTTVRNMDGFKEFITASRFDVTDSRIESLHGAIKSAFYIDKLLLPPRTETGEMTAYEIQERLQQMQTILGPVLSRLNAEVLTLLVRRSLNILMRAGIIPPLPDSVLAKAQSNGKTSIDYSVMFINSLARSQQLGELKNIQVWLQETMALAQMKPEVLDGLNADKVLEHMAQVRDIPTSFLLPPETVQALREQRQQQMEQQQMLQSGEQIGNIVKNVGSAQPKGT